METQYFKDYSPALGRDMEMKVYGHAGRPVLFIPCQDGRFFDFENFKMTDAWSLWIDSGQVMVFSIDTMDKESWSDKEGNPYWRIRRYEQWIAYITDEVVPFMRSMVNERNGWTGEPGVMAFGCSLGATHAVNLFFFCKRHQARDIHTVNVICLPCGALCRVGMARRRHNRLDSHAISNLNQRDRLWIAAKDQQFLTFKFFDHFHFSFRSQSVYCSPCPISRKGNSLSVIMS